MAECGFCDKYICTHAMVQISEKGSVCTNCGATDLSLLCIPVENGDPVKHSDFFRNCCKECYDKYSKEIELKELVADIRNKLTPLGTLLYILNNDNIPEHFKLETIEIAKSAYDHIVTELKDESLIKKGII